MDAQYNLSNLEAGFKQYLLTVNTKPLNSITIKNYLSDFRHFWGWLNSDLRGLKADSRRSVGIDFLQNITINLIESYKSYLTNDRIPPKTVNRRLSTLRKFGSFCISQGWMKENPFKKITNVIPNASPVIPSVSEGSYGSLESSRVKRGILRTLTSDSSVVPRLRSGLPRNDILIEYEKFLSQQSLDRQNINNLIANVEEFYQLTQNL